MLAGTKINDKFQKTNVY